jgi:type II secretory pathway pseudopilin PulG
LVELLVVITIIAILAALLLPPLNKTKVKAQSLGSLNNLQQLQLAWETYHLDSNDNLSPNEQEVAQTVSSPAEIDEELRCLLLAVAAR